MNSIFRTLIAGLALAVPLSAAQAGTFANFTQDVGAAKVFSFLNTGTAATTGLFTQPTTVQVNFFFLTPTADPSIGVGQLLTANLTITSQAVGAATIGAVTISQELQSVQMSFIGVGGTINGKNLLTLTASTGTLGGELSAATAGLEETDGVGGGIVTYSSAYLNFDTATDRNYSITLNNINNPGISRDLNGFMTAFSSNGTGQFAANNFIVPEPSTLAFLSFGALGLAICRKSKKPHC